MKIETLWRKTKAENGKCTSTRLVVQMLTAGTSDCGSATVGPQPEGDPVAAQAIRTTDRSDKLANNLISVAVRLER